MPLACCSASRTLQTQQHSFCKLNVYGSTINCSHQYIWYSWFIRPKVRKLSSMIYCYVEVDPLFLYPSLYCQIFSLTKHDAKYKLWPKQPPSLWLCVGAAPRDSTWLCTGGALGGCVGTPPRKQLPTAARARVRPTMEARAMGRSKTRQDFGEKIWRP